MTDRTASNKAARWFALALAGLVVAGPASGRADDADQLVASAGYPAYYDRIAQAAVLAATARLQQADPPLNDLPGAIAKLQQAMDDHRATFLAQLASSYRTQFSEDELQQLASFYSTSAGQKMVATFPLIQDALGQLTRQTGLFAGMTVGRLMQ